MFHSQSCWIKIDPSKIQTNIGISTLRTETEVRGFLGRINYIGRCIALLITTCEPLLKLLRKNALMVWKEDYQFAFEKIKTYLLNPLVLVWPVLGSPLLMYLTIYNFSIGCVLGQYDETGTKEQAICYQSKKFVKYKS